MSDIAAEVDPIYEASVQAALRVLSDYLTEQEGRGFSSEQRRAGIVQRLLAREAVGPRQLDILNYEIHASRHLGVVAQGPGASEVLQRLKSVFGWGLLGLAPEETKTWAWIAGSQSTAVADIEAVSNAVEFDVCVAVGEPARGLEGWLLTHHQAHAALEVALRRSARFASYADDRLLAAALQNETLQQRYLVALDGQRDGGDKLCRTLRAYIEAECNATSAAQALRVNRRAVNRRVRAAEGLIGRPLRSCLAEMDVALRIHDLRRKASSTTTAALALADQLTWKDAGCAVGRAVPSQLRMPSRP
jgi:hypothetical protein